ncbi:phosphoribosyltransferase family protein [Paucibacter sp. APW11]|uniref:Phosphoribosyltransferase family protein n=1 Tax=Roseateles aquae TaxID=3077235 RepID=A0ABU3PF51_9BURK|nr:phosphoribosyltransferase family protein [Paucibacter sp. APW11]MDT9001206.1 phosphoribosyltransferase family protein [Paucibacter sp. APW11]
MLSQMEAALDAAQVHPPKLLLCVPLSATRLAERGYNQAHELARRLAARRGLAYAPMALERIKDQHKQSLLDREARASNVRHAFLVNPQATGLLQGQRVAIVDDIMTTGATLNELARLLRRAGASEVQAWVLARA